MSIDFYNEIQCRWKVAIVCSLVLSLLVFTRIGLRLFGFMLPAIWLALAIGILLFSVLSFAAKEEKRKRSLIAVCLGVASIVYAGIAVGDEFVI